MEKKELNIKLVFGTIIGAAILLVVLTMTFNALNVGANHTETFAVTDPTLDQSNDLTNTPDPDKVTVEQYTGVSWETVPNANVTIAGKTVTVDAGILYG